MRNLFYMQKVISKERREPPFVLLDNIASGRDHALAVVDGIVYAWGYNSRGQLGDGTIVQKNIPTNISDKGSLSGTYITKVFAGHNHSLALDDQGRLHAWGDNDGRQLGTGSTASYVNLPALVTTSGVLSGKVITDAAAGLYHTICIDSAGKCYAWGDNSYGEVGDNSTTLRSSPVEVYVAGALFGKTVKKVTAGSSHCVVLDIDGAIYSWGRNQGGSLGIGSTVSSKVPNVVDIGSRLATCLGTGSNHSIICTSDGQLMAWGLNDYSQIGVGGTADQTSPVIVTHLGSLEPSDVSSVFAGGFFSGAVTKRGAVYTVGHNSWGQLGVGDQSTRDTYTLVEGMLSDIKINYVSGGYYFVTSIDNSKNMYSWGHNLYGQLGNNRVSPTETLSSSPVAI